MPVVKLLLPGLNFEFLY